MEKLCTWKLLRTTRRTQIHSPFVHHTPLTYQTRNFPLRFICPKTRNTGILSRMFPPFAGITYYRVRAHLTPPFALSCIVMHLFALYSLFLPPLLSGRLRDRRCCSPVWLRCWRPLLLARTTSQAPPLDHQISPILLYTACIRVV